MNGMAVLLIVVTNICYAASSIFFKVGVNGLGHIEVSPATIVGLSLRLLSSAAFLAGLGAAVAGTACFFLLLSRFNLSYIYPLMSLAYVFVAVGSVVFLKESVSLVNWAGVLLVCVGVALVSLKVQ
jgi:undecaprenyl phosphate-alpha-L-ara4N flippase subunit ArnF